MGRGKCAMELDTSKFCLILYRLQVVHATDAQQYRIKIILGSDKDS